jgi:hypothetical protein
MLSNVPHSARMALVCADTISVVVQVPSADSFVSYGEHGLLSNRCGDLTVC